MASSECLRIPFCDQRLFLDVLGPLVLIARGLLPFQDQICPKHCREGGLTWIGILESGTHGPAFSGNGPLKHLHFGFLAFCEKGHVTPDINAYVELCLSGQR
jgi:hypothetical protein